MGTAFLPGGDTEAHPLQLGAPTRRAPRAAHPDRSQPNARAHTKRNDHCNLYNHERTHTVPAGARPCSLQWQLLDSAEETRGRSLECRGRQQRACSSSIDYASPDTVSTDPRHRCSPLGSLALSSQTTMRLAFALVALVGSASAFSVLPAAPSRGVVASSSHLASSVRVTDGVSMFGGGSKAAPKKVSLSLTSPRANQRVTGCAHTTTRPECKPIRIGVSLLDGFIF